MELSPNDIRNFEFPTQLRGYDKEAVDNFKEQMAQSLEMGKQERSRLTAEIESLRVQLSGLKQFEDVIKKAAIDARRNADATISGAKKEAEEMLNSAREEASQTIAERTQKRDELESQITKLELTRKSYLSKLRSLIASHLTWVEEFSHTEFAATPSVDDIEVTDSSEVSNQTRETIATESGPEESIHTEEANAAQQIILAQQAPAHAKGPAAQAPAEPPAEPQPEPAPQVVDPELEAALNNYRKLAESRAKKVAAAQAQPPAPARPAPRTAPAATRVTNQPVGDFPDGFVTPSMENEVTESTDKMQQIAEQPTEHNKVNLDVQVSETLAEPEQPDDDLAKVLDNVVHKFEETMDKASKG
jgi:cell division initiation protein